MDLGAVFLVLAVVTLAGLFVLQPFNAQARRRAGASQSISALLAERDRLLSALQELDFDHSLGKIPAEEYPGQRSRLVARTAEVLRQLDALAPDRLAVRAEKGSDEKLEALIARRRSAPWASDEAAEALIARRKAARAVAFCPRCGKAVQPDDAFCSACGKALK